MSDAPRTNTGNVVRGTLAPGRERAGGGIVWLDRLSLVATDSSHPSFGPPAALVRASEAHEVPGEPMVSVGAKVEIPPGYLVVDVRVGYATAAEGFVCQLRVVDLAGHRKAALFFLGQEQAGDEPAENLFADERAAPAERQTFLSVRMAVARSVDHVALRGLSLSLTRV